MRAAEAGPTDLAGRRVGRFELIEEIGRGVMAVVYKAHDPLIQRVVALKVIDPAFAISEGERASFDERFLSEARIAGRLAHPGIVVVHDVGTDTATGRLFIALEYLAGHTLDALTASHTPLDWREALRITGRVAEALHYAHEQGIVHRDVKPANIMVLPSGEPKVMDFGMAKLAAAAYGTKGTSRLLGAPLYLSPEQAQAEEGDRRTDIFSLGAVAYRLLTGRDAFAAESIAKVLERVIREDPPPPSEVVPGLPAEVDRIVARAMAKSAKDRYTDADSLAEDITDVLAGRLPQHGEPASIAVTPADTMYRLAVRAVPGSEATWFPGEHTTVRRRAWRRVAAGVALLVGVALLHLLRQGDRPAFAPLPEAARAGATASPVPLLPEGAPTSPKGAQRPAPQVAPLDAGTRAAQELTPEDAALVTLDFRHELRSGRLLVFVDGEPVLDQAVRGRASKQLLGKRYRGSVRELIRVAPGRRKLRVQVRWQDDQQSATTIRTFEAGSRRSLRATMDGGLFSKRLSLSWQ